jgi:signal transduction histidine kinase
VVVPLWVDGARLAIDNVLRNALGHAGPEPRVVVRVDGARVVVDDDGPGIAPADRARVLGRFERGGASAGSGLGLAIAHQVALAHGGAISIDDAPSGGARVVISFTA